MTNASGKRTPEPKDRIEQIVESATGLSHSFIHAGTVMGASYTLIGAIVLLGGLGAVADRWFDTYPWLLVTGLFLGIVVGFYELARVIWRRTP
jgi:F0F1-type ATP synthase assembly protein I